MRNSQRERERESRKEMQKGWKLIDGEGGIGFLRILKLNSRYK